MSAKHCTAPATTALNWGDSDHGGTRFACDEHREAVGDWMEHDGLLPIDEDGVYGAGEECAWEPHMTAERIAEDRVRREDARAQRLAEVSSAWVAAGCPGAPAVAATIRAAVGDDALAELAGWLLARDVYELARLS